MGLGRVTLGVTARMNNPSQVLPDSMKAFQSIASTRRSPAFEV
jgi:hypothetical protein